MSAKIHIFTEKDIEEFVIFRELSKDESEYLNGATVETAETILAEYVAANNKYAFLASKNSKIVGQLFLTVHKHKLFINLISILISEQGTGLAKQLFEKAFEIAKSKDVFEIELIVHEDNTRAINFYKKMGFSFKERYKKSKKLTYTKILKAVSKEDLSYQSKLMKW